MIEQAADSPNAFNNPSLPDGFFTVFSGAWLVGIYLNLLWNEHIHLFHCHHEPDLHRCFPHTPTLCIIDTTVFSPTIISSFQSEQGEINLGIWYSPARLRYHLSCHTNICRICQISAQYCHICHGAVMTFRIDVRDAFLPFLLSFVYVLMPWDVSSFYWKLQVRSTSPLNQLFIVVFTVYVCCS